MRWDNNLDNEGQFNVVGSGTASVTIPFNNNGAVTVSNVTLQLSGGGTETGLFTNAAGGTLNLGGGTTPSPPAAALSARAISWSAVARTSWEAA